MTQAFIVLLAWWAGSTVDAFLPHKIRSVTFRRQSYLNAALNVGDAVIAEVDDILGSVSDPKVSFLIRNEGKTTRALMSTKLLSSTERLALQAGSVMQVYVSKVEEDDQLQVSLKPADGSKPIVIRETASVKTEVNTFKPVRVAMKPQKKQETQPPKIPSGGLLLSSLKTGMELEGIVQSCTAYAAFVSAGVYRAGKAGSFQAINGMLHKVDIVDKSFLTVGSRKSSRNNRGYDSSENTAEGIISVGTRIKVYVKEVYKQSGRLTLTTDPTIDKLRVREQKLEIRSAGNNRRRARRLRRQLEKVALGDTVSGVILQVIPAGILVSVNSLGPLNVTGLIAKSDLPKQFEVPPDLKESFQKQLLEQDFAVGRQITCSVLQVNPNSGDKVAYNLKMFFEELGALAADNVPVRDSGDKSEMSDDDDEDETAEEIFDDSDLKEIFDELRGAKPLLSVSDLKDWGDVQDMIESQIIDLDDLEGAITEVTGKPKGKAVTLTFEQFVEIVDILQDAMEGMTTDLDEFDDEDDDEEDSTPPPAPISVKATPLVISTKTATKTPMKMVLELEPETKVEGSRPFAKDSMMKETAPRDDDLKRPSLAIRRSVAMDGFNLLKGKNDKVLVTALKTSQGVEEMLEDGVVTPDQLDEIVTSVVGDKKYIDFEDFFKIAAELDKTAEEGNLYLQGTDEENETDSEDDSEESDELDEEDLKEVAKELFDELRGKDKKVSVAAIMAWEDVKEMIEDEVVTKEQIKDIISGVAGDKKALDFDEFYEVVSQLDDAAESADDMEEAEILESSLGFGGSSSDDVDEDDFEVMNDEEVDEMLQDVYEELRGKSKSLTMKAFKKWEDISEMVDSKIIDEVTIDKLALKVGCDSSKSLSFPQFKALVEMLDELAGEGDDSEEMDRNDSDNDDRLEIDAEELNSDSADDDDEEMTPEEVEEMTRDLFDTLRGKSKNLSVATFLSWDNIQDQTVLDDDTIDILLQEVGANSNRKGDLTYQQFSDLINLLDETVTALGDGEGQNMDIIDDEDLDDSADSVSATLEEREEIDDEIETERNERNVLDGIDDEGVDEIANEIYQDLKGKDELLSVKAFSAWEDVVELIDQGIIMKSTVDLLIKEVGASKTQTLTFDQFWKLVNLLEEASDAAADKVAAGTEEEDLDDIDMTPEEEEAMTLEVFNNLKNPKTGLVASKKLKNWGSIAEALDSGEMSKGMLNSAIKKVGAELDFEMFKKLMLLLEEAMEEREEAGETVSAPVANVSGKGFAKAADPVVAVAAAAVPKGKASKAVVSDSESEANIITREIYEDLRGNGKTVSLDDLREWEDLQEMIESGSLKRSTLEKALVKIGAIASNDLSLQQFIQLIDIIQGSVDDSNLKYEYEEDSVKGKVFETSKKSSVLTSEGDEEDDEEENWGDDESGGDARELTEEEAAREAFDELVAEGASTISLVDFLQWEDVQELLEVGAISKDGLATAIENAGVSVEQDGITFEKFYDLLQVIDEFVDREKLPVEQSDVVFESKIIIDKDSNVGDVMDMMEGFIGEDEDDENLKITYLSNKTGSVPAEGDDAIQALQDDFEDDEDDEESEETEDEELLEMFEELSKGKDYITEKALRKWDELQELIEADLATQEVIDSYISRIEITNGRVSLEAFRHFMKMLDMVIIDESGNFMTMDEADEADRKV